MSDAEGEEGAEGEGEGEEEKKEEAPKAPKPPSETQTKLADQAKYIAGKFETLFATTGKIQVLSILFPTFVLASLSFISPQSINSHLPPIDAVFIQDVAF